MSRIAFVCSDAGIPVFGTKGASVHAQSVLAVLADAGHDVHVLSPRPGPEDHPLRDRVQVHPLPAIGSGPAAERERRAQTSDAAAAPVLDALRPDLVYERYSLWGRTPMTWAERRGVRGVLEVDSPLIDEQAHHRTLADPGTACAVARTAMSAAARVVCVSRPVAAWAARYTAHPERIRVLPNGVDTDRIRPRAPQAADRPVTAPFTVGFLGTLKPWHGVEILVDALGLLPRDEYRLLVVGDGPLRADLARRVREAGIHAEFTGAVHPDAVAGHLQRMDAACAPYPAAEDHYFSPLKVYEYLAAGLPVVASRIGQIPAILDGGALGRLVPPGDPRALASALADLRGDRAGRRALGAAARAAALERHTWTRIVKEAIAA